jgi:hypothetical protein
MSAEWPETREAIAYQTVEGDHLARVAALHGLRAFAAIWEHADNAPLRKQRTSPHVLAPGDLVHLPAVRPGVADRQTEQRHRFQAKLSTLRLRVKRQHEDGTPVTVPPTAVACDGETVAFTASAELLDTPITPITRACSVTAPDVDLVLTIGYLQPVSTVPGFRERLNNLGYRAGDSEDVDTNTMRSAIEEFQCDQGLVVDGRCGPVTQQRLRAVHGC